MPVQPCPQLCRLQMSPDVARCAAGIKIPPGRELPHTESSQPLWRRCNNSHLTYKDTKVLPDVVCAQVHSSGAEGGLCGLQGPGSLPTPAGSFPGHSGAAPKLRSLSNPRTPVSHQAPCPQARGPPVRLQCLYLLCLTVKRAHSGGPSPSRSAKSRSCWKEHLSLTWAEP